MEKLGVPKKGAVARLRKLYNERREKTLTAIREKQNKNDEKTTDAPVKRIAKSNHDLESL